MQEAVDRIWPDGIVEMPLAPDESYFNFTRSYQEPYAAFGTRTSSTSAKQTEGLSGGRSRIPKRTHRMKSSDHSRITRSSSAPDGEGFTFETEAEGITEPEFMTDRRHP